MPRRKPDPFATPEMQESRLKTSERWNNYRKGSLPKLCLDMVMRNNGTITIRELLSKGDNGMAKYLAQLIGEGVIVAENLPSWDNNEEEGSFDLTQNPTAFDFLEQFFKHGGNLEELMHEVQIISGAEQQSSGDMDSDLLLLERLLKPKAGYEPPDVIETKVDILPEEWPRLVGLAKVRENILMVGPSGCGKTYIANRLADELELPFSAISCTAGMDESQLFGLLIPLGPQGQMEYASPPFVEIYENGGVFLFDEFDAADENTLMSVNSALANKSFWLPLRKKNPYAKQHKDFICIAAANTWGHGESIQYSARTQLDAATLDRFGTGLVKMDYSPRVEEMLVAPIVLAWGKRIRAAIEKHRIPRFLSTRRLLRFTKQAQTLGWTRKEWEYSYFADWTKEDLSKMRHERVLRNR